MCAFEQEGQWPLQKYLLWANSKTGQAYIVDFPNKNRLSWSFKKMNVVYEDEDYRVYCKKMRYSPYHTWFMDKRTGEQYFFPVATGQVLRFNG